MTNSASVALAYALLLNEYSLFNNSSVLKDEYLPSKLVYLLSVCLLLRRVNIFPKSLWTKSSLICLLLETLLALAILEFSIVHIWSRVQNYVQDNSESFLVFLVDRLDMEWLVCQACCGKQDCAAIFAGLEMKALSFLVLVCVCAVLVR